MVTNWTSSQGFGYAGFQTNGIFRGEHKGKVINFSIWGSNDGKSDGWVNPDNAESGGYQLMYPFEWTEGTAYRFELREGPSGIDADGKWWGIWVTDQSDGTVTFIGEQRVPNVIDGKDASLMNGHTSMFGEDLHWWRTLNGRVGYHCGDFEASSMAARDITANGGTAVPEEFSSFTNSGGDNVGGGGHETTNCFVPLYTDEDGGVQHNLGYWADAAPHIP